MLFTASVIVTFTVAVTVAARIILHDLYTVLPVEDNFTWIEFNLWFTINL